MPPDCPGPARPRAALSLAALGALLGLAAGCSSGIATTGTVALVAPDSRDERVVRRGTFQERFLLTGELQAVRSDKIVVPRTTSWQTTIRWMEQDGAQVALGQRVLELDNSQFAGELEQKRLAHDKALNDLAKKRADVEVELADREFDVAKHRIDLAKARLDAEIPAALLPLRDHQERQLARAKAEAQLVKSEDLLEAARRAVQAELAELEIALGKARTEIAIAERAIGELTLHAPRAGILVVADHEREGRKLAVGDSVWVGLPVMSIPDLSAMQVTAKLSDVDDDRIAVGMRAQCTLDAYPELEFIGRVAEIAPIAQEDSMQSQRRHFRAIVGLEASDAERMRPGMSVRVAVLPAPLAEVLVAPRSALDVAHEPPRAWLADGSTTDVTLGPCDAQACVIEAGLADGARLAEGG